MHRRGRAARFRHPDVPAATSDHPGGVHPRASRQFRVHLRHGHGPWTSDRRGRTWHGRAAMTSTEISTTPDQCTIPVTGMTCAACSGRIQRSLERTPGVASANVNLMTGSATVRYDPDTISPAGLVDVIR